MFFVLLKYVVVKSQNGVQRRKEADPSCLKMGLAADVSLFTWPAAVPFNSREYYCVNCKFLYLNIRLNSFNDEAFLIVLSLLVLHRINVYR